MTIEIYDTTLRDGEQSPGATLNIQEKLEIARQLSRLGVDICEAGFPIASPGDFEAVRRIAEEIGTPPLLMTDDEIDEVIAANSRPGGIAEVDASRDETQVWQQVERVLKTGLGL